MRRLLCGPPCLSPLSRPPFCVHGTALNSIMAQHKTQCHLKTTNDPVITEPFTTYEVAVNELSPRSTQSVERFTMSPMINALTNTTVASVDSNGRGRYRSDRTEKNYQEPFSHT